MTKLTIGAGETAVTCSFELIGEDLLVSVYGGTQPHIGAIALGIPRPSLKLDGSFSATVSVLTLTGHKDDAVARLVAQEVAAELQRTTVVLAGLHIDSAAPEQIQAFMANAAKLPGQICGLVQPAPTPNPPPHPKH